MASVTQSILSRDIGGHQDNRCPACAGGPMVSLVDLGEMPCMVGLQWASAEAARNCPRGRIQLAYCSQCGFINNAAFSENRLDYHQPYDNALDVSPLFRAYEEGLARHLINAYDLHGRDIIEIGCGKGHFLELICRLGNNRGTGFDPSIQNRVTTTSGGGSVRFIADYFSPRHVRHAVDMIVCRHVFEHIVEPMQFLHTLRESLADRPRTGVYFEVPSFDHVLRDVALWTVIYEHCSYFCREPMVGLFERCGFSVRSVQESYDGQFLGIEAVASSSGSSPSPTNKCSSELVHCLSSLADQCNRKIADWRQRLHRLQHERKRIAGWGAGARAVSFLNALGITSQVPYVVDINPRKIGHYVPGTAQPIVPPEFLAEYRPDVVILMNGVYQEEVAAKVRSLGLNVEFIHA